MKRSNKNKDQDVGEVIPEPLSFAALDARIRAMPDGPAAVLQTPRWISILNALGTVAIVVGMLPFVLVQWLTPQMWMVDVALFGAWTAGLAYVPGFGRAVWVVTKEFWRWRSKLVEQSDHDLAQFRDLRLWLATFPREALEEHRNFAQLARDRLTSKLGLLIGGLDRVGILPVLLALFLLLREVEGLGIGSLRDMPFWQALLGPFLAITYLIGVLAARMRLQFELYEMMLADAVAHLRSDPVLTPEHGAAGGAGP